MSAPRLGIRAVRWEMRAVRREMHAVVRETRAVPRETPAARPDRLPLGARCTQLGSAREHPAV